ncbi:hypothetical protein DL93DRAFT_2072496 [Clavulina sp. PMI_390]|nr:hypothetical protein DL93DRAFT_2072496 [Clavulina sp. PMI_390]
MSQRRGRASSANSTTRRTRRLSVDGPQQALALAQLQEENVYLFVPNLIGYTRIILAALSLHYMATHPKYCTLLYGVSCLLDAVDGYAARRFKQESEFGAVLDMVTDRCTTSCLLCFLSSAYPAYALVFQFLITLDFMSHFMHMYRYLKTGGESHKKVDKDVSFILNLYYTNRMTLFIVCAFNELFFISLYLIKKWDTAVPLGGVFLQLALLAPKSLAPLIANVTWPQLLAAITGPICLMKNIINVVQLWKASKILVGIDIATRQLKRLEESMKEKDE